MSAEETPVTTLIIARHGNTFGPGDVPTRVGKGTDLPLVEKGVRQGQALGLYLLAQGIRPDMVVTSTLQRTKQTAKMALESAMLGHVPVKVSPLFDEIHYGPDENKTEDQVISRIGAEAIEKWDKQAVPPQGWDVDVAAIKAGWLQFSDDILKSHRGQTVMVVTSNGTARFAPVLTGDFDGFVAAHDIKLSTGAYAVLRHNGGDADHWTVEAWNTRPPIE